MTLFLEEPVAFSPVMITALTGYLSCPLAVARVRFQVVVPGGVTARRPSNRIRRCGLPARP
jgi:hypothetical protein